MEPEAEHSPSQFTLQHLLRRLTLRWRFSLAIKGGGWGIIAGLVCLLAVALISRSVAIWTSLDVRQTIFWYIVGGGTSGVLAGVLYPRPVTQRLRIFDSKLVLADRLTTAWELEHGRITAPLPLVQLQLEETRLRVEEADIKGIFPARPSRSNLITASILTLLLVPALFLPNPQDSVLAERKAEAQFVSQAVEKITSNRDTLAQQTSLSSDEQATALAALEQALDVLNDRQTSLEEKQAALALAEYQLAELRTPDSLTIAQQLASVPVLSDDSKLPDDSAIQHLSEALTKGNIEAASAILENLSQGKSEQQLTPNEVQDLAAIMAQLATALLEQEPEAASALDAAARAITEGDTASAREMLQHAADSLYDLAEVQAKEAALQQAQAGLQQAQQSLREASDSGTGQLGAPTASAAMGQTGNSNETGEGIGNSDHNEGGDSGSVGTPSDTGRERLAAVGGEITIPRSPGEGVPLPAPGAPNDARVPYQEVYIEYVNTAEAGLSRRDYPPLLRDYIRDYFSSLEE